MGSHSVTCHPAEVRIPPLPPAEAGTRFSDPGGMQGWVDLCYVKATGRELNPRHVNRKSNALPLSHHAKQNGTKYCFERRFSKWTWVQGAARPHCENCYNSHVSWWILILFASMVTDMNTLQRSYKIHHFTLIVSAHYLAKLRTTKNGLNMPVKLMRS